MKSTTCKRFITAGVLFLLVFSIAFSQTSKPTLEKEDYNQWQSLQSSLISPDGNWVAWSVRLVEGNDTLFIKSMSSDKSYSYKHGSVLQFSENSKWVAFRIGYSEDEIEKKREKKETIKFKLQLLNLETGKDELFEDISSFQFNKKADHIVMVTYPPKGSESKGNDIILRNLKNGKTRNIGNVSEWSFNKKGDLLTYIIDANGKKGNGVEIFRLENYQVDVIDSDTATYGKLTWEKEGRAFAFLKAIYDTNFVEQTHKVFAIKNLDHPQILILDPIPGVILPDSMRVKETFTPYWSEDLSILFFGIFDWTPVETDKKEEKEKGKEDEGAKEAKKPKTPKKNEKIPGLDIWHWLDDPIQPRQQKIYTQDKNFTYLCAWNLDTKKVIRITNEEFRDSRMAGDQKHVVVWNKQPYQPQFRMEHADYKIVNVNTGVKTNLFENFNLRFFYGSSPDGKYLLYFQDDQWWSYDIYSKKHTNLTGNIDTDFWNTRDDRPEEKKPPFGYGGWMKNDRKVLVYDEYDTWTLNPDGSGTEKITNGKEEEIIYRVNRLDYEEDWLDPEQPLYFRMFGDKTKKSGYMRISSNGKIENLIYEDKSIGRLSKAKFADQFIFVSESYEDSPDLFYVGKSFKKANQVSETNPQQKDYAWGKTELISFQNTDGKSLQGVLHYPANYEDGKKFPMVVYIYEIRSNSMHRYIVPSPRSSYNITNYVQQGYFVYQPDIIYKTNHPGESAVECVVPGVEKVIESGMIDTDKIGLMGHSWGAYQTAFIITQTELFSAAVAGAPLTNMISMYNSIYWNSGTPDQQIFETSQGRLREPYWKIMDEYIANSPLFQAENISTPLLVAFGDQDGAVDWHQGIELYITMRRMEKPMIMLVYEGENHGLSKKENQLDYTLKVNQFFNHFLTGKDAPDWIDRGVTYLEKKKKEEKSMKK